MLVDERGRRCTFGEYRDHAERVAAGLLALGVGPGTCLSWQLPTGMEAAVLIAAAARLGAVQNPIIGSLREHEVRLIVDQCEPELLVVPSVWRGFDYASMAEAVVAGRATRLLVCDLTERPDESLSLPTGDPRSLPPVHRPDPEDELPVRWIFYSSGTTDRPKGVKHTDRALLAAGNNLRIGTGLSATDRYPMCYPIAHIGGPAFVCAQLSVGSQVLLMERFDAATSPQVMADYGATVLGSGLPFFAAYLAAQAQQGEPLFPALRISAAGGAPTPPELHMLVK
jgi:acyl-coenzyme A synthetase/AMP-(fatty) acid ligase